MPEREPPAEVKIASQFPEIERLLETEDFDKINKTLTTTYEELEKAMKGRGGIGKSRDAKKAMRAIERVMDLLKELLKVKYQLMDAAGGGGLGPQRKK